MEINMVKLKKLGLVFLLVPSLITEHKISAGNMSGGKIAGISIGAAVVITGIL